MPNVGLIILAAGGSSRMGTPKQLLAHGKTDELGTLAPPASGQETLLTHALSAALQSCCYPVLVVLGAKAGLIRPMLPESDAYIIENPNWSDGLSSSLRLGIDTLNEKFAETEAAVIVTCDQPFLSNNVIDQLVAQFEHSAKPIVAARYADDTLGVPALFSRSLFADLCALQGDIGARQIIRNHPNLVAVVEFPEGALDIDTPADYQAMGAHF